jgi:hypothetical protein
VYPPDVLGSAVTEASFHRHYKSTEVGERTLSGDYAEYFCFSPVCFKSCAFPNIGVLPVNPQDVSHMYKEKILLREEKALYTPHREKVWVDRSDQRDYVSHVMLPICI